MSQKSRSLLILLGLLAIGAAVGGYAWFGVYQQGKRDEAEKTRTDTLFAFKKDEVKKLTVTAKGETTAAERAETDWNIVAPLKTLGDTAPLDAIADKLAGLKQLREVKAPSGPEAYGLDKPRVKVVATLADGKTAELDIGADNPYDGTIYARKADDPRVSILEASIRPPLEKNTFDLRDKRLFVFEEGDLKHLDVAAAKTTYALERSDDGKWSLTAPQSFPADDSKASQIASSLRGLRATRFVSDQATEQDLVRYGLAHPAATVTLLLGKNPEKKTLLLGEVSEGGTSHVYAKRSELGSIAEVSPAILKDLDQSVSDLRDKTVLSFDSMQVLGLRFNVGGATFGASRTAAVDGGAFGDWKLSEAGAGPAKKWRLSALVGAMHDLKGASIVSDHATEAELKKDGLQPPLQKVTLLGPGDKVLAELLVGNVDQLKTYVKAADGPRVFLTETTRLSPLPANLQDLVETPPAVDGGGAAAAAVTSTPDKN